MHILSHPRIKDLSVDKDNFAATASLEGEYSLAELRTRRDELIGSVQRDFQSGAYRLLTLSPQSIHQAGIEDERDAMWVEATTGAAGGSKDNVYLDNRTADSYYALSWHSHPRYASSMCIQSGSVPTLFAGDEDELAELLHGGRKNYDIISRPWCNDLFTGDLPYIVNKLSAQWWISRSKESAKQIFSLMSDIKQRLKGKRIIMPQLGTINLFDRGLIHVAGNPENDEREPGELYAEFWNQAV